MWTCPTARPAPTRRPRARVDALSPELRDVVELRFDQGFKVGEIADVLGVSRFAVNRRLNRALAELRRGLEGKDEA